MIAEPRTVRRGAFASPEPSTLSERDAPAGQVLLITDDRDAAGVLSRWIGAVGLEVVVVSGAEIALMKEGDDDRVTLVVTDLETGAPDLLALLERLLAGALFRGIPQIHLIRDPARLRALRQGDPTGAAALMAGPPQAEDLQARVRLAAELGRLRRESARHATTDPLTGLANRRSLFHRIGQEISRARRYRTPLSLVVVDVDGLKAVNDAHGQGAGDAVLRDVGRLIESHVRREDVCGRIGEDSFAVLLPGNRYRGAAVLANKIRTEADAMAVAFGGLGITLHVSAGIATYPDSPGVSSADDLVRCAENALRGAKERGGNRVLIDEATLRKERRIILVVDPDTELLDLTEDLLSVDDYRVLKAATAHTAMETLRVRRPDLLVLDLSTAEGDGGPPLLERIQAMFPGSRFPIIGLLRDPAADPEKLARLGVDRFITKPFSLTLLRSAARELLESYGSQTGPAR